MTLGRSRGRVISRRCGRIRAQDGRGLLQPWVEVGPEAADHAHDDADVVEDVGQQDDPDGVAADRTGGPARAKAAISQPLSRPLGPSRVVKAAATTTVGMTKGMVVSARSRALPGKS